MSKRYFGYYDSQDLPIKAGDTVTIRKGTVVKNVRYPGGQKAAAKTYKVRVDHVLNGTNDFVLDDQGRQQLDRNRPGYVLMKPIKAPSIRWPGPGGYWSEVDINDVL